MKIRTAAAHVSGFIPRDEDLYDIKHSLEVSAGFTVILCAGNILIYFIIEFFLSAWRKKNQETSGREKRKEEDDNVWYLAHNEIIKFTSHTKRCQSTEDDYDGVMKHE